MTTDSLFYGRQAAVKLDIVIVGGGISGLATAFALTKAGHRCTILEQRDANGINRYHGAINIPSNLTKILDQWGVSSQCMDSTACKPLGLEYLMYRTGTRIGGVQWNELVLDATGNDYYLADFADFYDVMFRLARDAGATIRYGCAVTSVNPDEPSVTLKSGEIVRGDIIVGADGCRSRVRDIVLDHSDNGVAKGEAVYIAKIPTERMVNDPDLKPLVDVPRMNEWMGPSRIMLAMPVKEVGSYIIYLIHPQGDPDVTEEWTTDDSIEKFRNEVVGWEPRVQKLMQLIDHAVDVKQVRRDPYDSWMHESGRVVLVGDACHPMPAHAIQKAAMAVEDAAVLGNLFSRIKSRDNVKFLLHAYQELRQTRCAYVQGREEIAHIAHPLQDGTAENLDQRDEELREKYLSKDVTPEQIDQLWEMSAEIFRYEVELEAEGWWADFGRLMSPLEEDSRASVFKDLGVSRSTVVMEAEGSPAPSAC